MSYIEQTAKMLGVEMNEEFEVYNVKEELIGTYAFDEIGFPDSKVLLNILNGTYTMVKKVYKPKNGEVYYFLAPDDNFNPAINKRTWGNYTIDYIYYFAGNIFRSVDEAKQLKDERMHKLIQYYEGENDD